MRLLISVFISMIFLSAAAGSMGIEYDIDGARAASGLGPERYCYNYTFIDTGTIKESLLHDDVPDDTLDLSGSVFYDRDLNLCKPYGKTSLSSPGGPGMSGENGGHAEAPDDSPVLPNPRIAFVEDGKLSYDALQSRQTIFYGGIIPFVALPDNILDNEDHFFNQESFSLFLYFKKKF